MARREKVDWSECSLVEVTPLVESGAPVLRATRMPANAIVDNFDYGMSVAEIAEQFELSEEAVQAILTFAKSHRVAHPVWRRDCASSGCGYAWKLRLHRYSSSTQS